MWWERFADENDSPVGADYAANGVNNYNLTFPVVADTEQVLSLLRREQGADEHDC